MKYCNLPSFFPSSSHHVWVWSSEAETRRLHAKVRRSRSLPAHLLRHASGADPQPIGTHSSLVFLRSLPKFWCSLDAPQWVTVVFPWPKPTTHDPSPNVAEAHFSPKHRKSNIRQMTNPTWASWTADGESYDDLSGATCSSQKIVFFMRNMGK